MFQSSSESSIEHGNFPSVINLYAAGQQVTTSCQTSKKFPENLPTTSEESTSYSYGTSSSSSNYKAVIKPDTGTVYFGQDREGSCGSPPSMRSSSDSDTDSDDTFVRTETRRNSTTSTSTNSSSDERLPKRLRMARARDANPSGLPPPAPRRVATLIHHSPLVHSSPVAQPLNIIASPSPSSNTVSSGGSGALTLRGAGAQGISLLAGGGQGGLHQHQKVRLEAGMVRAGDSIALHSQGADSGISNTSPETQSSTEFHHRSLEADSASGLSSTAQQHCLQAGSTPQSILKVSRDQQTPNQMAAAFKTSLFNLTSCIYAMVLIVLGSILPISEVVSPLVPYHVYEGFYIYLYSVGIGFLCYVYAYLLRTESTASPHRPYSTAGGSVPHQWPSSPASPLVGSDIAYTAVSLMSRHNSPRHHHRHQASSTLVSSTTVVVQPSQQPQRKRKVLLLHYSAMHASAGSFYLRLGTLVFGLASMIRDGLRFGRVFDTGSPASVCNTPVHAARHLLGLLFTFIQLYFIFLNSKMCIHKFKVLARFGLMHMIGTNLCVWLHTVIKEGFTEAPIWLQQSAKHSVGIVGLSSSSPLPSVALEGPNFALEPSRAGYQLLAKSSLTPSGVTTGLPAVVTSPRNYSLDCFGGELMGNVVRSANPYLFPCTVQYCLVATGILWVTWCNIGKFVGPRQDLTQDSPSPSLSRGGVGLHTTVSTGHTDRLRRLQVDCAGSNRGLFLGLSVLVCSLVSLIVFYVLLERSAYLPVALSVIYSAEIGLCGLSAIATILAFFKMQDMLYQADRDNSLDEALLLVGLAGVLVYSMTSILAGRYHSLEEGAPFVMASALVSLLDACVEALFVTTSLRRMSYKAIHDKEKPGRELISFLALSNLSLWILHSIEHTRVSAVQLHIRFMGPTVWTLVHQLVLPLVAFFRFHVAISLAVIWRRAYRFKST